MSLYPGALCVLLHWSESFGRARARPSGLTPCCLCRPCNGAKPRMCTQSIIVGEWINENQRGCPIKARDVFLNPKSQPPWDFFDIEKEWLACHFPLWQSPTVVEIDSFYFLRKLWLHKVWRNFVWISQAPPEVEKVSFPKCSRKGSTVYEYLKVLKYKCWHIMNLVLFYNIDCIL